MAVNGFLHEKTEGQIKVTFDSKNMPGRLMEFCPYVKIWDLMDNSRI